MLSADVTTYHNDLSRDGAQLAETHLKPSNVRAGTFGKKFTVAVDGYVYAQPLYATNLVFPRAGADPIHRNIVYVATEHDTLYAIDSDRNRIVWKDRLLNTTAAETPVPAADTGSDDVVPELGITSTPVIDRTANKIFVVANAKRMINGQPYYVYRLYSIDLVSGAKTSTIIHASMNGSGVGSVNGTVSLDPLTSLQRSALTLVNGNVYFATSSHGDEGIYHGWVLGYDENTLAQTAVWTDTPDGENGGIWMAGSGIAADSDGDLFLAIGNGTFDVNTGGHDYAQGIVRIPTSGVGGGGGAPFSPADFFTAHDFSLLNDGDQDIGSGGVVLLPDQPGANPHEAVFSGKQGFYYLVDRDNLGGFDANADHVLQVMNVGANGDFSTPAYFNGRVYVNDVDAQLKSMTVNGGLSDPDQQTSATYDYPGVTPSISANGVNNGIVWIISRNDGRAVLQAFYASNLSKRIFSSDTNRADRAGGYVKFSVPTIGDGKVFVGGQGRLDVYGLL